MINENWKPIEGYEGLYEVSDLGNVRSLNYRKTGVIQVLKLSSDKGGYLKLNLYKEGKMRMHTIHRLVAQAFIPNPDGLPEVNHRDENKTNNCVANLEYCDRSYNINYGTRNEKISKAKSIPVAQYSKEGELIAIYYGAMEASRQTGIHQGNIIECCKGKRKTSEGYIWKYA